MGKMQMQTVFLTCNGNSERYGKLQPKWKLSTRDGRCLASLALSGLRGQFHVTAVVREGEDLKAVKQQIANGNKGLSIDVIALPPTNNQVETVKQALLLTKHKGCFVVRDCDNLVEAELPGTGNFTIVSRLEDNPDVPAYNKSYVKLSGFHSISETAEKQVISNLFNVGAYGFESAAEFLAVCDEATSITNVHQQLIWEGERVVAIKAQRFEDWGTAKDWRMHRRRGGTIFIDVDGCLVFDNNEQKGQTIDRNISYLNRLKDSGHFCLIVTTCRDESERKKTQRQLAKLKYDQLIMGLPRGRRFLINDIWEQRGEKSAIAISLPQNSESLEEMFQAEGVEL
jgi:hypothetical protein